MKGFIITFLLHSHFMKSMFRPFALSLFSLAFVLGFSGVALAVVPPVATNPATGITSSDATLNGTIGGADATGHSFWVSTSTINTSSPTIPAGVYSTPDFGSITAGTSFSATLSSVTTSGVPSHLPPVTSGTTYHYVAWAYVGGNWIPDSEQTFTTLAVTAPSVTSPASGARVNSGGVNVNGTADANATVVISGGSSPATTTADGSGNWSTTVHLNFGSNVDTTNNLSVVAIDAANNYSNATPLTVVMDNTNPVLTLSSSASNPTGTSPVPFAAHFSESVADFDATDVAVTGGTLGGFSGSGQDYTFSVTPAADPSTINVSVAANAAHDAANNGANAASVSRVYSGTVQTVVVTSADLDHTSSNPAVVVADGLNKWFGYDDTSDTVNNALATFVSGPGTPPAGSGSVQFTAASSLYRGNIATYQFASTSLASITALRFSAYSHSGSGASATESPYLAFNVDFTGSNTWQKRLVYVPSVNGAVPQDTWNTFDTIGSSLWEYSGATWPAPNAQPGTTPKTWSQILTDYPNAGILKSDGWLGVRVGEPGPANYTGNVDNVVVGTAASTKIFDFEPITPPSCSASSSFDSDTLGSVNGQGGWRVTGSYDQAVVSNTYGYASFGCRTLRISDAVTSGNFGDQIFSASTTNEAGETAASSTTFASGTRQTHFETQFDLGSAVPGAVQTGLSLSVSPDRGDGARMSYLRFEDRSDGIHVFFDDTTNAGPLGTATTWNESDIATLDRSVPHTIKFSIDFVDGPANDVVKIYIDGVLVKTGTTWEDYYRYDSEQAGGHNAVPTVDAVLFREGGDSNSADVGKGFLIDNFSELSSTPTAPTPTPTPTPSSGGGGGGGIISGSSSYGFVNTNPTGGVVLGTSTEATSGQGAGSCSALLTQYLGLGRKNDTAQVKLLQTFLNGNLGTKLPVTGFFGPLTYAAVKQFQLKYKTAILDPWGISDPTGYVYKFTQYEINLLSCSTLNALAPTAN